VFIASAKLVALNQRVNHCFLQVTRQNKKEKLFDTLEQILGNNDDVLVFVNSISMSNDVTSYLVNRGIKATPINGFLL